MDSACIEIHLPTPESKLDPISRLFRDREGEGGGGASREKGREAGERGG